MVFHILPMLAIAAGQAYLQKKRRENQAHNSYLDRAREAKKSLLRAISAKITRTPSYTEVPSLEYDAYTGDKAVFLVTTPIAFGDFQLSRGIHDFLARHVGMTLNSVSHWALCVVDRGTGMCYCYELMSDEKTLKMLGKNVLRDPPVTEDMVGTWECCYYVGETTKSHYEIKEIATSHVSNKPVYNIITNNCQHMVETLVKAICDGKVISQQKLSQELVVASPKIGLYLMVAKLGGDIFLLNKALNSSTVSFDVKAIKGLWKLAN